MAKTIANVDLHGIELVAHESCVIHMPLRQIGIVTELVVNQNVTVRVKMRNDIEVSTPPTWLMVVPFDSFENSELDIADLIMKQRMMGGGYK